MPVYKRDPKTGRHVADNQPGYYYIKFQRDNQPPYIESLRGISSRRKAEKIEEQRLMDFKLGIDRRQRDNTLFEDFVKNTYLPHAKNHLRLYALVVHYSKVMCEYFKGKRLSEITTEAIEAFQRHRKEGITRRGEVRSPLTVNREVGQLSSVFQFAVRLKKIKENPCGQVANFRSDKGRTRIVTNEEEGRILAAMTGKLEPFRPFVVLALYTGMRRGEMLKLEWSRHINFEADKITMTGDITKNRRPRVVPMVEAVKTLLLELRQKGSADALIFENIHPVKVSQTITKVTRGLGLSDVCLHALRHTFASRLQEKGVGEYVSQKLMGHSSAAMTGHYTHVKFEQLQDAVQRLENR